MSNVLLAVVILFPLSEIALAVLKRAGPRSASLRDRGSMGFLWAVIGGSIVVAAAAQWVPAAAIGAPARTLNLIALVLMVVGLAVRWVSILTLGRLFTVNVAIQSDHDLVESGPYRYVRHPSYSGLLLTFVGLGFYFGNWLSLLALVVPTTLAVLRRIRIEERALQNALGEPYVGYCSRTRRLVPGLF